MAEPGGSAPAPARRQAGASKGRDYSEPAFHANGTAAAVKFVRLVHAGGAVPARWWLGPAAGGELEEEDEEEAPAADTAARSSLALAGGGGSAPASASAAAAAGGNGRKKKRRRRRLRADETPPVLDSPTAVANCLKRLVEPPWATKQQVPQQQGGGVNPHPRPQHGPSAAADWPASVKSLAAAFSRSTSHSSTYGCGLPGATRVLCGGAEALHALVTVGVEARSAFSSSAVVVIPAEFDWVNRRALVNFRHRRGDRTSAVVLPEELGAVTVVCSSASTGRLFFIAVAEFETEDSARRDGLGAQMQCSLSLICRSIDTQC